MPLNKALQNCREGFNRALENIPVDPASAIGMASTTLETICKSLLDYPMNQSLQPLLKVVTHRINMSLGGHAEPEIKRILGGLFNAGAGIATLMTKHSTFHGRGSNQVRLGERHARLAVNSLAAVGIFLIETYYERFEGK